MQIYGKDEALLPASILYNPGGIYSDSERLWQGIPTIEKIPDGSIYVSFYSGGKTEENGNFVLLVKRNNKEDSFSKPFLAIVPPTENTRCFDPCLWIDDRGRLLLFYAQSYGFFDGRIGVWLSVCDNPDAEEPVFSPPRRIANGVMMNKPTILKSGEWLLPCAIWGFVKGRENSLPEEQFSNVYRSVDHGETFERIGYADYAERYIDEHMIVEKNNGDLWMLIRRQTGIGQSVSKDKGYTWSEGEDSGLGGPGSRFCIRRLKSGKLILINHYNFTGRNNLTAMISDDDGKTWQGYLNLDERDNVSYPDMAEDEDGTIYIVYDRERYKDREILMATIKEEDISAGQLINESSALKILVNKCTGGYS